MKDAKGHGSNAHNDGTDRLTPVQRESLPFKHSIPGPHYLDPNDPRGQMTGSRPVGAGLHSAGITSTPQLQRRHFEAIAADLRAQAPQGPAKNFVDPHDPRNPQSNAAWDAHNARVNAMADKLSTINPLFKRDRFIAASTPGGVYNNRGPGMHPAAVSKKAAKFSSRVMATHDGPREKSGLGSGMWAKGGR